MVEGAGPRKIAILGGGIAALATAFELTSQPGWKDRFDITLHQMGWRLGGKCASSRGPNGRIEEHGIHGFLGSYYNALPLMAACYAELGRAPGAPLATFEAAFQPENFALMWEWRDKALRQWPQVFPTNRLSPADGTFFASIERLVAGSIEFLGHLLDQTHPRLLSVDSLLVAKGRELLAQASASLAQDLAAGPAHPLLEVVERGSAWLGGLLLHLIEDDDELRHAFIIVDYIAALIRGLLKDNVAANGFDALDDQNWSDWLASHGASPLTISSPLAFTTINLSYQYPAGDTSLAPVMAAGCYLHWTLRSFAFMGSMVWHFAAGTGETVIAPLYQVLEKRGVKFEFFHKVEALRLAADGRSVGAVEIAVQATLKNSSAGYQPLTEIKNLPSWPGTPDFDQLVEGPALRSAGVDLESYWTPWTAPARATLVAGRDYDEIVFAISIGAVPYLCAELMEANPAWRTMVAGIPALLTQTMQIWLAKDLYELGWGIPLAPGDTAIAATYLNPFDGQVEFRFLIPFEDWPADAEPKGLWYFCGLMAEDGPQPPFTDHDYPRRQHDRVKYQAIQYLQAGIGALLPGATPGAVNPPGDPAGFDFSLLVDTRDVPAAGVARFDSQFWRANVDPTERYVASPPGSTACRLKAWGSGFDNLVLAGDWIYTGLNVGSVEATVMSGKLAAFALSGAPALDTIIGYPAAAGPAA